MKGCTTTRAPGCCLVPTFFNNTSRRQDTQDSLQNASLAHRIPTEKRIPNSIQPVQTYPYPNLLHEKFLPRWSNSTSIRSHALFPQASTLPWESPLPLRLACPWICLQACSAASSLAPFTYCPSYQYKAEAVGPPEIETVQDQAVRFPRRSEIIL